MRISVGSAGVQVCVASHLEPVVGPAQQTPRCAPVPDPRSYERCWSGGGTQSGLCAFVNTQAFFILRALLRYTIETVVLAHLFEVEFNGLQCIYRVEHP